MHIYAYLFSRSNLFKSKIHLPSHWEGKKIFNLDYQLIPDSNFRSSLNSSLSSCRNCRLSLLNSFNKKHNTNIQYIDAEDPLTNFLSFDCPLAIESHCAYHKSIFNNMNKHDLLKLFDFNDFIKNLDIYKYLEDIQGTYNTAHLRKKDLLLPGNKTHGFVNFGCFYKAFEKFDIDPNSVHWISDSPIESPRSIFDFKVNSFYKNYKWKYPEGSSFDSSFGFDWLFDFLTMYFSQNLFRSFSSFSFWAGFLSMNRETPTQVFSAQISDNKIAHTKIVKADFVRGNHVHWASALHPEVPNLIIT